MRSKTKRAFTLLLSAVMIGSVATATIAPSAFALTGAQQYYRLNALGQTAEADRIKSAQYGRSYHGVSDALDVYVQQLKASVDQGDITDSKAKLDSLEHWYTDHTYFGRGSDYAQVSFLAGQIYEMEHKPDAAEQAYRDALSLSEVETSRIVVRAETPAEIAKHAQEHKEVRAQYARHLSAVLASKGNAAESEKYANLARSLGLKEQVPSTTTANNVAVIPEDATICVGDELKFAYKGAATEGLIPRCAGPQYAHRNVQPEGTRPAPHGLGVLD